MTEPRDNYHRPLGIRLRRTLQGPRMFHREVVIRIPVHDEKRGINESCRLLG